MTPQVRLGCGSVGGALGHGIPEAGFDLEVVQALADTGEFLKVETLLGLCEGFATDPDQFDGLFVLCSGGLEEE